MPTKENNLDYRLFKIFKLAIFIAITVVSAYLFNFHGPFSTNHSDWGAFGDFIGGVLNPLFSLLGLLALLLTIILQAEELGLTRKELKNSSDALIAQNETLTFQNFESSFFQMLRLHNDIVNSIDFVQGGGNKQVVTTSGRDCFLIMTDRLRERFNRLRHEHGSPSKDQALQIYEEFYDRHQVELGHYFRYLYNIFKFIHNSNRPNKKFYTNLVRAQISNYEMVIIFYNCLSKHGQKKFLPLVKEYAIFKNMPDSLLLDRKHKLWLSESA